MRLAALAPLDVARVLELRLRGRRRLEAGADLALELGEADAADRARRPDERAVDDLVGEADRVEDLRAAVARDVGDPHLRHDLEHAVLDRVLEAQLRLGRRGPVAADLVRRGHRGERLEREARADGLRAVAEQAGEVVHLARLVRLHDERRLRAKLPWRRAGGGRRRSASSAGIGAGPGAVSETSSIPAPARTAASASAASRSQAASRLVGRIEGRVEPDGLELLEGVREEEEAVELDAPRRPPGPPTAGARGFRARFAAT